MVSAAPHSLDVICERMATLPILKIGIISFEKGRQSLAPAFEFEGGAMARELAIDEAMLQRDVASVSIQIAHWGRLAAVARRNWQFCERNYRVWRDRIVLKACADSGDPKWKKPTEKSIEAMYRTAPDYMQYQTAIEAAEESYNSAVAMLDGFRAKKDMLRTAVFRSTEDSSPRLCI